MMSELAHSESCATCSCSDGGCGIERNSVKTEIIKLALAVVLGIIPLILRLGGLYAKAFYLAAWLLAGWDVLKAAGKNILRGKFMDELFLMSIASLGAFIIGAMEEAIGVMVFYRIGEMLQESASARSRRSIHEILALRPDKARVLRDGEWVVIDPEDVKPGEQILLRPGERLPVDGEVIDGYGSFDTASMTGESHPRPAGPGDGALAGFIARDAALIIKAARPASRSAAARIAELVEHASERKAKTEMFIRRFAKWYTPAVVLAASLVALVPPIFVPGQSFSVWVYRALVMLVISCPCAFVISVPLAYFAGLGGAARRGILVKGANTLDVLADADVMVFDKTGTLSDGNFSVQELEPALGFSRHSLLMYAVAAGAQSNHPLAKAVRDEWEKTGLAIPKGEASSYKELAGHGTETVLDGCQVLVGSDRYLHVMEIPHPCEEGRGTELHVAVCGNYAGRIELGDNLKEGGREAVGGLRRLGFKRLLMLSGDNRAAVERVSMEAGLDEAWGSLLPEGKMDRLETIIGEAAVERKRGSVVFVGDGINDAPVLSLADAGIAMGASGADAAIESADLVIMSDELERIPEAISRARRTRRIIIGNITIAFAVKLLFLGLGALGLAAMWEAIFADVGVALLAILNSSRALR